MQDRITENVIDKFIERSNEVSRKYGANLERKDFTFEEWLTYLQEELIDAVVYTERLKQEIKCPPYQDA